MSSYLMCLINLGNPVKWQLATDLKANATPQSTVLIPPPKHSRARRNIFKPNSQNIKTCISLKLMHQFQPNFAKERRPQNTLHSCSQWWPHIQQVKFNTLIVRSIFNYKMWHLLINITSLAIRVSGAGLQLGSFRMLQHKLFTFTKF